MQSAQWDDHVIIESHSISKGDNFVILFSALVHHIL